VSKILFAKLNYLKSKILKPMCCHLLCKYGTYQRGSTPMYSKSALFAMRVAYLPRMSNMYAKSSEILFSMRPRTM